MRRWFSRMGERLARFMYGRYGTDELNRFLTILSLILVLLAIIPLPFFWTLYFPALALLTWSNVRCFSRKIEKRRRQNARYLRLHRPVDDFRRLRKNKWRDRKTHRYFKCKKCRAVLRVPRGRGKIDITCPRCGAITVKKS